MENENTNNANTATSEQPEEQKMKRITAMQDVIEGGADDWGKRVIRGVQQYIDVIQQALNPMKSEDLPFVTAALKLYRDGIREDLDPAGQKLDKTIREIVNKNGTTRCAKVSHAVQVHAATEEGAKKVVEIIRTRPEGKELEEALIAAGFEKRGNEWYEIEDGESEETEEVD